MKYKITKLDRRHNGWGRYKYSIVPDTYNKIEGHQLLNDLREWCWATYGPGAELVWSKKDAKWAWDTEHGNRRIYLRSDAELTFFNLKYVD